MTVPTRRREASELLERLYELLTELGLRPPDLVKQLRRDGSRIRFLSELSVAELRAQVEDCERACAS